MLAREIRELGVYSEIHPHDISAEELKKLYPVKREGVEMLISHLAMAYQRPLFTAIAALISSIMSTSIPSFFTNSIFSPTFLF